jgi:hypothetical protein
MAVNFDAIDEQLNLKEMQKGIDEAGKNMEDVPKGTYICDLVKMEIGATKKDNRPMFIIQVKVLEGEYKNRNLFMNRVIYGTKNDGSMIQSVQTILEKFETGIDTTFRGYMAFVDTVADIYENVQGIVELEIDWDEKAFNSISIKEVYDK